MIKVGLIGAGKMGISHLSILGAHPDVEIVGVSDTSKLVLDVLKKYSGFKVFSDYSKMLDEVKPEAVVVAVPTKFHTIINKTLLSKGIHVFSEKPLALKAEEGEELVRLAKEKGLITQVGYHNKFIGTFMEAKRLINGGHIGDIFHFTGESYGPVVVKNKQNNWRADPEEGGGCLMDYAAHVIDLINYVIGPIERVSGAKLESYYSRNVEDGVYSLLELASGVGGVLSVNWSDETYRKMSTSVTALGSKGKIICDATEIKVYFKSSDVPGGYTKGWTIKHINDFAVPVDFYLRGEEYSAQIDYFIKSIQKVVPNDINTFETAWQTDRVISLIKNCAKK